MSRPRKKPHNIYRDGKVHVCKDLCETCIFHPGNRMHLMPGRVAGMIKSAQRDDSAIVCHSTLDGDNAVCRGYYDKHATASLQIAQRLGCVVEVEPPAKVH